MTQASALSASQACWERSARNRDWLKSAPTLRVVDVRRPKQNAIGLHRNAPPLGDFGVADLFAHLIRIFTQRRGDSAASRSVDHQQNAFIEFLGFVDLSAADLRGDGLGAFQKQNRVCAGDQPAQPLPPRLAPHDVFNVDIRVDVVLDQAVPQRTREAEITAGIGEKYAKSL